MNHLPTAEIAERAENPRGKGFGLRFIHGAENKCGTMYTHELQLRRIMDRFGKSSADKLNEAEVRIEEIQKEGLSPRTRR
jgi:hypothetical protein